MDNVKSKVIYMNRKEPKEVIIDLYSILWQRRAATHKPSDQVDRDVLDMFMDELSLVLHDQPALLYALKRRTQDLQLPSTLEVLPNDQ